jgi:formylglycine-generating enzyme required for sulfatase activity
MRYGTKNNDGSAYVSPDLIFTKRVLRGGSYTDDSAELRTRYRSSRIQSRSGCDIGFRLARSH